MGLDLKKHKKFAPIMAIIGANFLQFWGTSRPFLTFGHPKISNFMRFFVLRVRLYRGTKYNTP